jgi:hypothetical protein
LGFGFGAVVSTTRFSRVVTVRSITVTLICFFGGICFAVGDRDSESCFLFSIEKLRLQNTIPFNTYDQSATTFRIVSPYNFTLLGPNP